jgi:probable F420-dependent oxidoreductase
VHPFRFGVQLSKAPTGRAWRDLARRVESLGYSTLFIPDHLDDQLAPIAALTSAAEATETLRVGSLVFDNDYRHPLVLAKEMATLDLLSEGRLEVGLGAGWQRSDYEQSGIAYDPPGVRVARLQESVAIMKALWQQENVTFEGEHYRITAARGLPRPHSKPHPPLIIGGGSPKVLAFAAREAAIVGINPSLVAGHVGPEITAEIGIGKYHERVGWVREAAGERFSELELQCLTFVVSVGEAREVVLERLAPLFSLPPAEVGKVPLALVGTVGEIVETLVGRRDELGLSYWVVHEPELVAFAEVVAALAGH